MRLFVSITNVDRSPTTLTPLQSSPVHAKRTMYKTLKVEITNPDEISKSLKTIT